ncbi:unnamed protein product, partial [Rotaria magnacalcarata]
MRPNVVFLGFKNDWLTKPQSTVDYFNMLHDALDLNYGVGILRLQSGLDFTDFFGQDLPEDQDDDDDDDNEDSVDEEKPEKFVSSSPLRRNSKCSQPRQSNVVMLKNTILNKGALITMNVFHSKHSLSTIIDVWWLFDDGGLTLLLPYLLRRRKRWRHSQFRIFSCVSGEKVDAEKQHLAMASLLKKFRINYTDLHVLHGLNKTPNEN